MLWRRISSSFHQDERANAHHHAMALHMGRVYLCLGSPIMSCPVKKQMSLLLEHQWLPNRIFIDPEAPWKEKRAVICRIRCWGSYWASACPCLQVWSVVCSPCLAVKSLGKEPEATFLYLFRKMEQRIREPFDNSSPEDPRCDSPAAWSRLAYSVLQVLLPLVLAPVKTYKS